MPTSPGPGGIDPSSDLAQLLAPVGRLPQALTVMTQELTAIRALLGGNTVGAQDPNARAAALGMAGGGGSNPQAGQTIGSNMPAGGGQIPSSARGGTILPPQGAPAPGSTVGGSGGGVGVAPPASGGGGGGGPTGTGTPSNPIAGLVTSMNQSSGSGLVNRVYGGIIDKMPLASIPNSVRNEYQSQINKNNWYTGIAGADSQREAFSYRIEEEKNRLSYGRLFSEEEARLAYKGTIEQGYNRGSDERQGRASQKEVMDAMYAAKERSGITPEEMLNYTGTAARTATQNMSALVDSLDELSESVGRAGGNAQQARANFDRSWNQGISGGMTGAASQSWAAAATSVNAGLGPMFANSNPMAHLTQDKGYQYIIAAQMGVNAGQLTSMMSTDPTAVANQQSQTFVQYMGSYISSSNPEGWEWLKNEVSTGARDPAIIAEDFVSNHFGSMDPNAYVYMAQTFGVESAENLQDPISVTRYLVKEMSGNTTGAALAGQQAKVGAMDMSGKSKSTGLTGSSKSLEEALGKHAPSKVGSAAKGILGMLGQPSYGTGGDGLGSAAQTYYDKAKASGTRYGGIEQVLNKMDSGADSQMVEVQAPDGKRIVTMDQAIKFYPEQLQSGIARFVGGKYGGKDISAITGQVDASARGAGIEEGKQTNRTKSHGYVGRTDDDYYRDHPGDKAKDTTSQSKAIIDLTPRAAKFFEIKGYEDADSKGEPRDNDNGWGSRLRSASEWTSPVGIGQKIFGG